jgi:flotillin
MTAILIAAGFVALVLFFLATYKVIGSNEAHVVVIMGSGRKIYSPVPGEGVKAKTAYFYIPFLMKRYIMPLTNVKLNVDNIHLNDIQVAPFVCDVITWLHIAEPVKAAERLDFTKDVFTGLHSDLTAIVQAVARAAAMKQEILDIMRDRATFSRGVSSEVDVVLKEWGVQLVNLEVNDIRDREGSEVISNYELQRKAQVESMTRIEVAKRDREAVEQEQDNKQKAEVATALAQRTFTTAQIEKDAAIGIAEQNKEQTIAEAQKIANATKIEALRVTEVGKEDVEKQATIARAEGEGEYIRIKGEKEANVITLTGSAEGDAIRAKGLAEAEAKEKMAEALAKFNDAATGIEKIHAYRDIQIAFASAQGKMAENAEIKLVSSGEGGNIFGFPVNAKTGADLGQFIEGMDASQVKDLAANIFKKKETK